MVLANSLPAIRKFEKIQEVHIPVIDLSAERSEVCKQIAKACEDYGFFKVINHGVYEDCIKKMEDESIKFFGKSALEKQKAGPANPWGYGSKNIGFNGDSGEVEYLIMDTNNLLSFCEKSQTIPSADPTRFRYHIYLYIHIYMQESLIFFK